MESPTEDMSDRNVMTSQNISSKAVMKYENVVSLTPYIQLDKHTNLNLPPSNWLRDNIAGKFATQKKKEAFDCSSLLMANKYPELIGEVDVISAADHIKKLLKTPFSNSALSMSVHCISKSLLINEIDIPGLLQSNFHLDKYNLQWLHDLYCSAANIPPNSELIPKKRNKEKSEKEMIQSKFMYYSIEEEKSNNNKIAETCVDSEQFIRLESLPNSYMDANNLSPEDINPIKEVLKPESAIPIGSNLPVGSCFLRDVLWTFEDITMLVGSDLPIFGGHKYPAVSLRLRDSSKPISILTGIDYWLDNLMCNVPELIMCYHLKGIVQKYEQLKTTDLPQMEGSGFSPIVIKDVAQNILSFLKANCTKEGHTYWLYKNDKDDIVKLYDLTSICAESSEDQHNPFTISVALLLYQIARNIISSNEVSEHNITRVRSLLQNCVLLLEKGGRPDISFLANYLLSELYSDFYKCSDTSSPYDTDDDISRSNTDDELSENEKSYDSSMTTVSVRNLCVPKRVRNNSVHYEVPLSSLDQECKCKKSLSFIIKALLALENLNSNENAAKECLKTSVSDLKCENEMQTVAVWQHKKTVFDSISHDLQVLKMSFGNKTNSSFFYSDVKDNLLERAAKCYITLSDINITKQKYGRALRFVQLACFCLISVKEPSTECSYLSVKCLMFYGDVLTMMAKETVNTESEKENLNSLNKTDNAFVSFLKLQDGGLVLLDIDVANIKECFQKTKEDLLIYSVCLYEKAVSNTDNDTDELVVTQIIELTRRLGNVRNELGVMFMNKAASMAKQYGTPSDIEVDYWKKSFGYFENSIAAFKVAGDRINQALVYSNSGRLMCLCAQVYGYSSRSSCDESRGQFTQQEKTHFGKAFEYYHKALSFLNSQENSPIWVNVSMELSRAYFMMANVLQDHAPLDSMAEEKVVKEVSSSLMKVLQYGEPVLKYCNEQQQSVITLRLGMVHQRLASLYHHVLRNQLSDHGKKNYRSLAELHYKKVYTTLDARIYPIETLRVIVLHAALHDYVLKQGYSGKTLKSKLEMLIHPNTESSKRLLSALEEVSRSLEFELEKTENDIDELTKALSLLEDQLNTTIKEVLKYMSIKKQKEASEFTVVKHLYEIVLRGSSKKDCGMLTKSKCLRNVVSDLQKSYTEIKF